MIEDIKSFFWFLSKGPKYYSTLFSLIITKFKPIKDSDRHIKIAKRWCQDNISTINECLLSIGINEENLILEEAFTKDYKWKISKIIDNSASDFGGPGHTDLIYTICEKLKIRNVVETGVAYGWSSAAILKSISKRDGRLISIDMPMLKQTDYDLIGVAIEKNYRKNWELRREPDRYALPKTISKMKNGIELFHYDSDKSYYGRKWSQEIIWKNLKKGGIFISDDIEDNTAFMEFVTENNLKFSILEFEKKFVGVIKKNL
ncbi:class I SAM-dependent methyltransferase [Gammaproteobacteria bacterium]|nr:class I SAM-dependent methyltransferase [Gammaproteobacteria bacterium]